MKAEEIFLKDLSDFINDDDVLTPIIKRKIHSLLLEYRDRVPAVVVVKNQVEVKEVFREVRRVIGVDEARELAKSFCNRRGVDYTEFIKSKKKKHKGWITGLRAEFCKEVLSVYVISRSLLGELLEVDHSTICYYVNERATA